MSEIIRSEQLANELAENPLLKFMELFSVFDPYLLGQTDRQRAKLYAELLNLFRRVSHTDKGFLPNHDLFTLVGKALAQLDDPLELLSTMEKYSEEKSNRRALEAARIRRIEQEREENVKLRELLSNANALVEELRQQIGTNSGEQARLLTWATVAPAISIVDSANYRSRLVADPVSLKSIDLLAWIATYEGSKKNKESHELTDALFSQRFKIPYGAFLHRPTKEMRQIAKFAAPDLGLSETAWSQAIFAALRWSEKMGMRANKAALVPIRVPVKGGVFAFPWKPEEQYRILGAADKSISVPEAGISETSRIRLRATSIIDVSPYLSLNRGLVVTKPFKIEVEDDEPFLLTVNDSEISERTRRAILPVTDSPEEVREIMHSDDPRMEAGGSEPLVGFVEACMAQALDRYLEVPGLILGLHT